MSIEGETKPRFEKCLDLAYSALENAIFSSDMENTAVLVEYANTCLRLSEAYFETEIYDYPFADEVE